MNSTRPHNSTQGPKNWATFTAPPALANHPTYISSDGYSNLSNCPRTLVLAAGSRRGALGVLHDGPRVGLLELIAVREAHDPGRALVIVSSVWMEG